MSKNFRISTLKSWIARTPEGRKKLTTRYQPLRVDQKEARRRSHENYLRMIGKL